MTLESAFKNLDPPDQSGIFFCLSLAGFTEHCIETDFVPIIERILEKPCAGADKKRVVSELATAMVASCDFSGGKPFPELYGRDPELLRGVTVMLILADSDDPGKARQKTAYSRKPDEARAQAVANIIRILEVESKTAIARLNGIELSKKWNEFVAALIPGGLVGMKGMGHDEIMARALRRIEFLSLWGKSVLQEYIRIIAAGTFDKSDAN